MNISEKNIHFIEKLIAIIIIFTTFIIIPIKVIQNGYLPTDDANRHVAFSTIDKSWSDILVIEPSLSSDHNAGWHYLLRFLHKTFGTNKEKLLAFSIVFLFLLFNFTGSLSAQNIAAWSITLLLMFVVDRTLFNRMLSGRPFIISCTVTIILLKLWFENSIKNNFSKILITITTLVLAVWLHGTWYTFFILSASLFLAGRIKDSLNLSILIIISTLIGAYLTGEFYQFLQFHYSATLNIFTERIYNWQLVTEFAEGNIHCFWLIPTFLIIIALIHLKKIKLKDLTEDPTFITILLAWLLSIKVVRFWVDWGIVALMFWLSCKISVLISEMQTMKKAFFKRLVFLLIIFSIIILIPKSCPRNSSERYNYMADFSKPNISEYAPEEGGIIYNDCMEHFYFNFYNYPNINCKYVLGFEPATMLSDDKATYREIVYSGFHQTSYKPWIDKLTIKDRLFSSSDLTSNYPQLDWVKANKQLWIGKIKNNGYK